MRTHTRTHAPIHLLSLLTYFAFAAAPAFAQDHELPAGHEGETAEEHAEHAHDEHGDELPAGHEGETAEEHAAHSHDQHDDEHAHGHDDHAHEDDGAHHITLDQPFRDSGFLITCVTFLCLVVLLVFGYKKAGAPALQNRRREIEEALADAQEKKAEAEALRKEYRERLDKMEEELARIRQEMIQTGEAERDRIVSEAESKAATMRKDVEFQISQKMKQLRDELTTETALAAITAAEALISSEAVPSDQSRLADDYLKNIAEAAAADHAQTQGSRA
ncbi:MAG: F-type H+-transporting ATPase subunit b [Polyangiales bacterium]|jgi:F-type H+-transporting ATPase subunit b